jgi:protein involved in polysaccharide export with SLBB domain
MVFPVSDLRRNLIEVRGAVWVEGLVGFTPGMKLSDAIRLSGGLKPDFLPGQVLISRLQHDSTRIQLRGTFQDSTGTLVDDIPLMEYDQILIFSRTSFRPERYVAITGAVRKPGQLPYREGMTLRDAILQADGLTEDASIAEAEVARLPSAQDRDSGRVAAALRVPLDSTYLFERTSAGKYLGPPGKPAPAGGSPEIELFPYDNILVFRQPDWELQRTVAITGAVVYPGRYSLQTRTDRLTDLITRAGGLTKAAYPQGVTFVREIDRGGRIGVDLPAALKDPKDLDNLILAGGDSIFIPEYKPGGVCPGSSQRADLGGLRAGAEHGLLRRRGRRILPKGRRRPILRHPAEWQGRKREAPVPVGGREAHAQGRRRCLCTRENTNSAQGDSRHVGSPGSHSREPDDRDSRAQEVATA